VKTFRPCVAEYLGTFYLSLRARALVVRGLHGLHGTVSEASGGAAYPRGVRNKPSGHEPFASGGSCSRGLLLTQTGRFAAGAGRRVTDQPPRDTSAQRVSICVIRVIRG
jgi:hypothetical protein